MYRLYSLHRLWILQRFLRKLNGRGLAQSHMHSRALPLCMQTILQLLSSVLGRLCTMKATIFICIYNFSPNTFLVHRQHMQSSAILNLPTLAHTHTHTHACTDAHMHSVLAHVCPHNALHSSSMIVGGIMRLYTISVTTYIMIFCNNL